MNIHRIVFLILCVSHFPTLCYGLEMEYSENEFLDRVQPLLKKYCQDCHGPDEANSKIRVDVLDYPLSTKQLFDWDKISHVLSAPDVDIRMPPEDEEQPTESERQLLTEWVAKELVRVRENETSNHGYARRLTKSQYRNTLRDLLLLDDDFTSVLPNDAVTKEGYHSMEVMQVSPLHLEYYFEIATKALDQVIVDAAQPPLIHNFRVALGANINSDTLEERRILGAGSRLIPLANFTVEELTPKKRFPFTLHEFQREFSFIEGYIGNGTIRKQKDFSSIYHNVFACLRGQGGYPKGTAETIVDEGLLLRPSIPNTGIFQMGSTYGPSPNFKISLRELPLHGNFRIKVIASKYDDFLLLDRGHRPIDSSLNRSIVVPMTDSTSSSVTIPSDGIYQVDMTYLCKSNKENIQLAFNDRENEFVVNKTQLAKHDVIEMDGHGKLYDSILIQDPQNGKRTLSLSEVTIQSNGHDITSEAKITFSSEHQKNTVANLVDGDKSSVFHSLSEPKPWVKFTFEKPQTIDTLHIANTTEKNRIDNIIGIDISMKLKDELVHRHLVEPVHTEATSSFALIDLKRGETSVELIKSNNAKINHVIFSRLDDADPWVDEFVKFQSRDPQMGTYLGFRRDCGSALSRVDAAQAVSSNEPRAFYFSDAIHNYPISVMDKKNKNYLAGISEIGVRNEYLDGRDSPRLLIHSVEFEGPFFETWPPESHRRIFVDSQHKEDPAKYAAEIIRKFMDRAYRRPVNDREFSRIFQIWSTSYSTKADFRMSIKDALTVVLCSPQFLLLTDASESAANEPVTEYELASKLSYFLWNSPPDDKLIKLAGAKQLRMSLDDQIDRMLADSKSRYFFQTFSTQWLNLDKITTVETNRSKYPRLTKHVKNNLVQEPIRFLEYLSQNNLELSNIIESEFTLANDVVAGYYGLAQQERGLKFVKTQLSEERGGLLTQAGILAGLSDGSESNPVKRGNWIARKIVAEPPGDPPPNVPELQEIEGKFTLRERLEMHRNQEGCVKCHTKIDPWGIPLEDFDAAGIMKTDADSLSVLPDGRSIKNSRELKEYLLAEKMDQVAFGFMQHLSTYALGRELTFRELGDLKKIAHQQKSNHYRIKDIVKSIANSQMFQTK